MLDAFDLEIACPVASLSWYAISVLSPLSTDMNEEAGPLWRRSWRSSADLQSGPKSMACSSYTSPHLPQTISPSINLTAPPHSLHICAI